MIGLFQKSLLTRTVALVCAPLLIAVALTVLAAIDYSQQDARGALTRRAERTVALLAGGAADALWNLDRPAAVSLLRPVTSDPDFAGVRIVDSYGAVFAAFGTDGPAAPGVLITRVPLLHGSGAASDGRIGTLEFRLDSTQGEALIFDRARTIALFGCGLLVIVCGLLVLIVHGVTKPIRAMTHTMANLAAGNPDVSVPATRRRDEVGRMAAALATLKEHAAERLRYIERQAGLMEEIERTVAQRTRALRDALETLQRTQEELVRSEKMAALGGMVAAMAHEINTPLGNGLTVATTLIEKVKGFRALMEGKELRRSVLLGYADDFDTAVQLLVGNLGRAADLIGGFKRVAVDQTSELRRTFLLDEVCGEVVAMLRPTYKHASVTMEVTLPEGVLLDSYPGALGQVITNLVSNAVLHGFTPDRGGTVRIGAGLPVDGRVTLMIADDGAGIPPAVLPRIFDPFFTTKFGAGGSGLGLHIVYALVTRVLGGAIAVESTVGVGTSFTIVLPLTAPVRPSDDPPTVDTNQRAAAAA